MRGKLLYSIKRKLPAVKDLEIKIRMDDATTYSDKENLTEENLDMLHAAGSEGG